MQDSIIEANDLVPGSAMHPGELLRNELEARGMKQVELAKELGIAKNVMSEIINVKRNLTAELAVSLENALGIKAEFWMKYQMAYEIDKIKIKNKKAVQKVNISSKEAASRYLSPMDVFCGEMIIYHFKLLT